MKKFAFSVMCCWLGATLLYYIAHAATNNPSILKISGIIGTPLGLMFQGQYQKYKDLAQTKLCKKEEDDENK